MVTMERLLEAQDIVRCKVWVPKAALLHQYGDRAEFLVRDSGQGRFGFLLPGACTWEQPGGYELYLVEDSYPIRHYPGHGAETVFSVAREALSDFLRDEHDPGNKRERATLYGVPFSALSPFTWIKGKRSVQYLSSLFTEQTYAAFQVRQEDLAYYPELVPDSGFPDENVPILQRVYKESGRNRPYAAIELVPGRSYTVAYKNRGTKWKRITEEWPAEKLAEDFLCSRRAQVRKQKPQEYRRQAEWESSRLRTRLEI